MALRVLCLAHPDSWRGTNVVKALSKGIARWGDEAFYGEHWDGTVSYDAVVAYGWRDLKGSLLAYQAAARPWVFIDGGYWGREKDCTLPHGYHKVVVNRRHPTVRLDLPADRYARFGLPVLPWTNGGRHILLAGMSAKNSADLGIGREEWERAALDALKSHTDRPIIYRPKPTCARAHVLPGAKFSPPSQPLAAVMKDCWAVVTHHSNVGVDALTAGVPIYTEEGAARPFSMGSIAEIEQPVRPEGRERFLNGLAYCQWNLTELASGACWDFIRPEVVSGEAVRPTADPDRRA